MLKKCFNFIKDTQNYSRSEINIMATTVKKSIFDLKPQSNNTSIYGKKENISDIKLSILLKGVKEPLIISENNTIISGHRRWAACKELVNEGHKEFEMVECFIEHYDDEEQLLDEIATHNVQRTKGIETIAREALILKQEYSVEAQKRKLTGKKSDLVPNLGQGRTIDFVANSIKDKGFKISRNNVTVLIQAIEFIDNKSNQKIDVDVIRHELNRNKVSCNYSVLKFLLENVKTISKENKRKFISDDIDIKALKTEICKTQEITPSEDNLPKTPDELLKVINDFRKSPEYNSNSTMIRIFDEISHNLKFVECINNVLNGKFIEKIQPILNLDLWKKLNYFSDKDVNVIKFTIIKTLAIMVNADCWQKQDEHENYDYAYDIELSLIDFANNFLGSEHNYHFEKLTDFFIQFNDYISEYKIVDELQNFLDDCNLPHAVLAVDQYFYSLLDYEISPNDLPFVDILFEFATSKDDYYYVDDEYSDDLGYDRRFTDVYVKERQETIDDFFSRYIDDYYTEITEEEEDDNE